MTNYVHIPHDQVRPGFVIQDLDVVESIRPHAGCNLRENCLEIVTHGNMTRYSKGDTVPVMTEWVAVGLLNAGDYLYSATLGAVPADQLSESVSPNLSVVRIVVRPVPVEDEYIPIPVDELRVGFVTRDGRIASLHRHEGCMHGNCYAIVLAGGKRIHVAEPEKIDVKVENVPARDIKVGDSLVFDDAPREVTQKRGYYFALKPRAGGSLSGIVRRPDSHVLRIVVEVPSPIKEPELKPQAITANLARHVWILHDDVPRLVADYDRKEGASWVSVTFGDGGKALFFGITHTFEIPKTRLVSVAEITHGDVIQYGTEACFVSAVIVGTPLVRAELVGVVTREKKSGQWKLGDKVPVFTDVKIPEPAVVSVRAKDLRIGTYVKLPGALRRVTALSTDFMHGRTIVYFTDGQEMNVPSDKLFEVGTPDDDLTGAAINLRVGQTVYHEDTIKVVRSVYVRRLEYEIDIAFSDDTRATVPGEERFDFALLKDQHPRGWVYLVTIISVTGAVLELREITVGRRITSLTAAQELVQILPFGALVGGVSLLREPMR